MVHTDVTLKRTVLDGPPTPSSPGAVLLHALTCAGESIVVTDVLGRILFVNNAFTALTGYARDEAVGQTPALWRSGQQPRPFYDELWRSLRDRACWAGALINRHRSGSLFAAELIITSVVDDHSIMEGYVGMLRPVLASTRPPAVPQVVEFGALHLHLERQLAFDGDGDGLGLTRHEWHLLTHLVAHEGQAVSRQQCLREVWGDNVYVSERSIDTHVSRLRKKIARTGCRINAVPGVGYRLLRAGA